MLICPSCGKQNPLGRVFCVSCGNRLDFTGVSAQAIVEAKRVSWFRRHWWKLLIALALAALGVAGLTVWPRSEIIGQSGQPVAAQTVPNRLAFIAGLKPGTTVGPFEFSEADLNAWLDYVLAKRTKAAFMRVSVQQGLVRLRMIGALFRVSLGKLTIEPKISYDLLLLPAGGQFQVARVSMGHLRLVGPLRKAPVRNVHAILSAQPEWQHLSHVIKTRAESGKLSIWVRK